MLLWLTLVFLQYILNQHLRICHEPKNLADLFLIYIVQESEACEHFQSSETTYGQHLNYWHSSWKYSAKNT